MSAPRLRHLSLVLGIGGFLLWFLLLRPVALGGPASYISVSGVSMLPTLESGDFVVLHAADDYANGDIVAFHVPEGEPGAGSLVIHRIVGGSAAEGFVMQGDNKPQPDAWRPMPDDIEGALWTTIPGVGSAVAWVRTPSILASLLAGLVVFFVLLSGSDTKRTPRRPAEGQR